ncbi:Protein phosphatase 1 regulatory inhibitor subunit PPP1R8-like protein, partial [Cucurbita argyrosperma subsp. sororia]
MHNRYLLTFRPLTSINPMIHQKRKELEAGPLVGQAQQLTQDGEAIDRINLDKRRHIFGRQFHTCDLVLDHPSVSGQHAAVIPHKNGSIYVIDLGSAHGTFVANERLTKEFPVELEAGQSLRFAASTRTYILRKNDVALFSHPPLPT